MGTWTGWRRFDHDGSDDGFELGQLLGRAARLMPGNDGEAIAGDIDDVDDIGRTDVSAAQAAGLIRACDWPEPDDFPVAFRDIEVGRDGQLDPLGREAPQGDVGGGRRDPALLRHQQARKLIGRRSSVDQRRFVMAGVGVGMADGPDSEQDPARSSVAIAGPLRRLPIDESPFLSRRPSLGTVKVNRATPTGCRQPLWITYSVRR